MCGEGVKALSSMSRAPKEHKEPAIGTSPSKPAPKTWSSILNTEPIERPVANDDNLVVEESDYKPLQNPLLQRKFTSTTPGSRFLTLDSNPGSRLPHLTPTIVLDDCSEAVANSCSAQPSANASRQVPSGANLSSSESDDDENENHPQPVAVSPPRKSPRIQKKKLRRVASSLSLDSSDSDSEAPVSPPVSPPTRTKNTVVLPRSSTEPRQMGLRNAQGASAGGNVQGPHHAEPSSKKQKPNRVGHKDVPSRATALLLQQQKDALLKKAHGVGTPKTFIGKCLLCNTQGALLTESSICRYHCHGASHPGPSVANGPNRSTTNGRTTTPTNKPAVPSRADLCSNPAPSVRRTAVTAAASPSAHPQRTGSASNVLGKRALEGVTTPSPPQPGQSPSAASQPKEKIPVVNLTEVGENDAIGRDRLYFFSNRPKRFDFPRNSPMSKFSPFAATAEAMGNGISSKDVCAGCGSVGGLIACRRCPLAFHRHCHVPPIKADLSRGFFCRACKTVKGNDTSSAYLPAVRPKPRPPPWQPLARLAADAADGNPMDLVLHPSLHKDFVRRCKADWLRCCRCRRVRIVGERSLSEYVRIPFECRDAFWASPKWSCFKHVSDSEKAQLPQAIANIQERSKRRLRLFYHDFGEEDRTSYGFFPTNEVVVLDDDDDTPPPKPSDKRTDSMSVKSKIPTANGREPEPGPVSRSAGIQKAPPGASNTVTNGGPHANAPAVSASQPVIQPRTPVQSSSSDARAAPSPSVTLRPAVQAASNRSPNSSMGPLNDSVRVDQTLPVTSARRDILTAPSRTTASEALASKQVASPAPPAPVPQHTTIAIQQQMPPAEPPATSHAAVPNNFSHATRTGVLSPASPVHTSSQSNPAQSRGLAPSPPTTSGPAGTSTVTPLINAASPVQHVPGMALPVQPVNVAGQPQGALAMPDGNLTGLHQSAVHQAMSTALQNSALNIARVAQGQHMITTQNAHAPEPGLSSVYEARRSDMRQASNGISAPATSYVGPPTQSIQIAREDPGWSGSGPPAAAASESLQQLMLKRIALLGESHEIEDTLVDLALENSPKLIQIFSAFHGNPSRFARQAARLARSTMNASPRA